MTLEQVSNRQKELNNLFVEHLLRLDYIVDKIAGKQSVSKNEEEGKLKEIKEVSSNGLVDEMNENLNDLEYLIDGLFKVKQKLHNHTFAPGEMLQQ